MRYLIRMGYERLAGYLEVGLRAWEISGRAYDRVGAVNASTLERRIKANEAFTRLDVRKITDRNPRAVMLPVAASIVLILLALEKMGL